MSQHPSVLVFPRRKLTSQRPELPPVSSLVLWHACARVSNRALDPASADLQQRLAQRDEFSKRLRAMRDQMQTVTSRPSTPLATYSSTHAGPTSDRLGEEMFELREQVQRLADENKAMQHKLLESEAR